MKISEEAMVDEASGRRKFLTALGMGLGGVLAFGGIAGFWRYMSGSKANSLLLLRRRSTRSQLPDQDSLFFPRDSHVRRRLAGPRRGA